MANLSTSSYYTMLETASGHRLVQQCGRANFYGSATVKTLTTQFRRLVYASVRAQRSPPAKSVNSGCLAVWPWVSTTMFTQNLLQQKRKVRVNRATAGAISTCIFTYDFIGY
jgi:hypothetical protein